MALRTPDLQVVKATGGRPNIGCDAAYVPTVSFSALVFAGKALPTSQADVLPYLKRSAPRPAQNTLKRFNLVQQLTPGAKFADLIKKGPVCSHNKGVTIVFYPTNV